MKKIIIQAIAALSSLSVCASAENNREDFRDESIYFVMTTRFYDGDPANNVLCHDNRANQIATRDPAWRGDFKGLIDKLDYIKALGFTAVWITPVVQNASGYDYHGYHTIDFGRVDDRLTSRRSQGSDTDVDFQTLIDEVHKRDMKLVLDVVLQHTGNYGERHLCPIFTRSGDIAAQADLDDCLTADTARLGADYFMLSPEARLERRKALMTNSDGINHDTSNLWHHFGPYGRYWNFEDETRWWGSIADDCLDLNTENRAVTDYIVDCYARFIAMGVDAFRIDTTGHIPALTMNSAFVPQFAALGEQYRDRRPGGAPFYMFGEVCNRDTAVVFHGRHDLSCHFYTWKSRPEMAQAWNSDSTWWNDMEVPEDGRLHGNMALAKADTVFEYRSDNALLRDGRYHEPDYSLASGLNVIDFPMHYNYSSPAEAVRIATEGDRYYNDATWNVVYVDSHDLAPLPDEHQRFTGSTDRWAENLSMLFTFRGIPCLYYGSEVEFKKGMPIDPGPSRPLRDSGRAYYGHYIEGDVRADGFGSYTADGQVAETLGGDLSTHIRQLNLIRAAVPALRKGQYSFEGAHAEPGAVAFRRVYHDSYALVTVSGGATFTGVPAGTYTDVVTGKKYKPRGKDGKISVKANGRGNLRVLVRDFDGDRIVGDAAYIFDRVPHPQGGHPVAEDPGTDSWHGPHN